VRGVVQRSETLSRVVRRGLLAAAVAAAAALAGPGTAHASLTDGQPFGNLEAVTADNEGVTVQGWAIDPDGGQTEVHVYVDGVPVMAVPATGHRPDVGDVFPAFGPDHGYTADIGSPTVSRGAHVVCVYGINRGPLAPNVFLGCRPVQFGHAPYGTIDSLVVRPGGVRLRGLAADPDAAAPAAVHVYVDGAPVTAAAAAIERPDSPSSLPGTAHGYDVALDLGLGSHEICVYGIDLTGDNNARIGCRPITLNGDPYGAVDVLARTPAGLHVLGWTFDPDGTGPVDLRIDTASGSIALAADLSRPDVAAMYPDYGDRHGFDVVVALPGVDDGPVCVTFVNTGPGADTRTCRTP
jgi:hypothetical protein